MVTMDRTRATDCRRHDWFRGAPTVGNVVPVDRSHRNMTPQPSEVSPSGVQPSLWSRGWAVVIVLSTILVTVVTVIGAPEIIRGPITVWFVVICPGMAIARLMGLARPLAEAMLAFALSLALAGLVPSVFLYLGAWSPGWSLFVLVAIAVVGLVLEPVLAPRDRRVWMGNVVRGRVVTSQAEPSIVVAPPAAPPPPATPPKPAKRRPPATGKTAAPTKRTSRRPSQVRPMTAEERSRRRQRKRDPDPGTGGG
jgi:hypothetical protein